MKLAFNIIAAVFEIYNLLCFVRIILTWIPSLSYSKFTQILAKICDPYLNLFHRFRWMTIGSFDFSPAIALCILGAFGSLFTSLGSAQKISLGIILDMLLQLIWSIAFSLLMFFTILLVVRLVILLINKNRFDSGNYIIEQIDRSISPLLYTLCKTFTGGRKVTYKTALIIGIIFFIVLQIAGTVLFGLLGNLVTSLPV